MPYFGFESLPLRHLVCLCRAGLSSRLNAAAFCAISELNRTGECKGWRHWGRQTPIFSVRQ